jgi:hypothetical protein
MKEESVFMKQFLAKSGCSCTSWACKKLCYIMLSNVSDSLKKIGLKVWFDAPNGPKIGEFIWSNILVK